MRAIPQHLSFVVELPYKNFCWLMYARHKAFAWPIIIFLQIPVYIHDFIKSNLYNLTIQVCDGYTLEFSLHLHSVIDLMCIME